MSSNPLTRVRIRYTLALIIFATLPCYCAGLAAVYLAPAVGTQPGSIITPILSPTFTPTSSPTSFPTFAPFPTLLSPTPTETPTATLTPTASVTPTPTPTETLTPTPT
ncbi:MAG: hypothetical protein R6V73_08745, partial [Anaerolineales bacterium]